MARTFGPCEHEWGDNKLVKTGRNDGDRSRLSTGSYNGGGEDKYYVGKQIGSQGQFCQKCNAWRGSLGLEPTPELFIQHIVQIFREVKRVLRKDGTLWLNMGDSYAGGGCGKTEKKGFRNASEYLGGGGQRQTPPGLKPKDLCGIPWRVALALQADGWWLRSDIIWSKNNPMPESVTDRPTRAHEYVFLLTKSAKYFYDADAVREPHQQDTIDRKDNWGRKKQPRLGADNFTYQMKEVYLNPAGRNLRSVWTIEEEDDWLLAELVIAIEKGLITKDQIIALLPNYRPKQSVWTIATEPTPEAHFATFPEKLVIPCIKAGTSEKGCCPECGAPWVRVVEKGEIQSTGGGYVRHEGNPNKLTGGEVKTIMEQREHKTIGWKQSCECGNPKTIPCTILDCFSGSGKVLTVAKKLFRKAIGIELSAEYCEMPVKKLKPGRLSF